MQVDRLVVSEGECGSACTALNAGWVSLAPPTRKRAQLSRTKRRCGHQPHVARQRSRGNRLRAQQDERRGNHQLVSDRVKERTKLGGCILEGGLGQGRGRMEGGRGGIVGGCCMRHTKHSCWLGIGIAGAPLHPHQLASQVAIEPVGQGCHDEQPRHGGGGVGRRPEPSRHDCGHGCHSTERQDRGECEDLLGGAGGWVGVGVGAELLRRRQCQVAAVVCISAAVITTNANNTAPCLCRHCLLHPLRTLHCTAHPPATACCCCQCKAAAAAPARCCYLHTGSCPAVAAAAAIRCSVGRCGGGVCRPLQRASSSGWRRAPTAAPLTQPCCAAANA